MSPSGFLNIDKPRGWTSHDVVAWVRRRSGQRRVGHTGTLDPEAQGVLVLCLGQATRLAQYVTTLPKRYRAQVRLGVVTATYDAAGPVMARGDASAVTQERVEAALAAFSGTIRQVPPAFSALKQEGQPLYRRARLGQAVSPSPRQVQIYRLALLDFDPPFLTLDVECGQGTYIRSLAHDLGQALGCGAHLKELVRLAVGPFHLREALSLEELALALEGGYWEELVHTPDSCLLGWPAWIVGPSSLEAVRQGQPIPWLRAGDTGPSSGELCRAYSGEGELVGLLRLDGAAGVARPEKVFIL